MLGAVIRDVGHEICKGAVALLEHSILVITECGRAKPECPLRLEGVAFRPQLREGGIDQTSLVDRRLAGDDIEPDSELTQVLILFGALGVHPDLAAAAHPFVFGKVPEPPPPLLQNPSPHPSPSSPVP